MRADLHAVVARIEAEVEWLDLAADAACWDSAAASNIEGRKAALVWVVRLLEVAA